MKKAALFGLHVVIAMMVTMVVGGLMCVIVNSWLGKSKNPWVDVPYSPLLWGSAFLLGLLLNRIMLNDSAKWVWIVGLAWLIIFVASDIRAYDPRWCRGCSLSQYVWYGYFSYWNCSQECMGQLLGTAPMLNSVAYSIGAALAQNYPMRIRSTR
jgi:hypothetical protein